MEGGKIAGRQLTFLMVWTIVSTGILYLPITISRHVTKDAWMIPITFLSSIIIALLATSIGLKYPDQTVIQYAHKIIGKAAGKVLGLVFIFWLIVTASIVVREFGEFMVVTLPLTPTVVTGVVFVLLACFAVKTGLEAIGRVSEILFPLVFFSITTVIILIIGEVDIKRMQPVLEKGILPVIRGTLTPLSYGGEIIVIMMLIPYLRPHMAARKVSVYAVLIVSLVGMQIETFSTGVFGEQRERLVFQHFHLIRMINIPNALERMDIVFVIVIIIGIFVKLSVLLYCSSLGIAQWLNIRTFKSLLLPVGVILVAMSNIFFSNISELIDFLDSIFPPFALSVEVGVPSILIFFNLFKKKEAK